MLSGDGDHPMTKLSKTQAVILSAASPARRRCGPAAARTLKIKGGAVTRSSAA